MHARSDSTSYTRSQIDLCCLVLVRLNETTDPNDKNPARETHKSLSSLTIDKCSCFFFFFFKRKRNSVRGAVDAFRGTHAFGWHDPRSCRVQARRVGKRERRGSKTTGRARAVLEFCR